MKKKSDLPTKTCPICQRSFAWRKKWKDCWPEVKYCSERCRRNRKGEAPEAAKTVNSTDTSQTHFTQS